LVSVTRADSEKSFQNIKENQHLLTYIILYKPYGVLCQFTSSGGRETLANFGNFQKDVYPIGRLDADSEGLVFLSNDRKLIHSLLEPKYRHPRSYIVQVERIPTEEALDILRRGVMIEKKKTLPADVKLLEKEPNPPPRSVPIRFRKNVPTTWLEITLHEGRNRQVRKMTATVGYPTLRLIRIRLGPLMLGDLKPGDSRELTLTEVEDLKNIFNSKINKIQYKSR
jgi:23S rRNA pseudouridine2457 synthase